MGRCYREGLGLAEDAVQAANYFAAAAKKGLAHGQYEFGRCLAEGYGTECDRVEAYKWLTLAANRAIHEAVDAREELMSQMSSEEIAEGAKRAKLISPKPQSTSPTAPSVRR